MARRTELGIGKFRSFFYKVENEVVKLGDSALRLKLYNYLPFQSLKKILKKLRPNPSNGSPPFPQERSFSRGLTSGPFF